MSINIAVQYQSTINQPSINQLIITLNQTETNILNRAVITTLAPLPSLYKSIYKPASCVESSRLRTLSQPSRLL